MRIKGIAGAPTNGATVLVVDDEVFCLKVIEAMLTRLGYSVVIANSGLDALHLFTANPDIRIDLALIDILMEDMTGLEVGRELRHLRPHLPIIFMSSYSRNRTLKPCNAPFLTKPFNSIKLAKTIREGMARKSPLWISARGANG